MLAERADKEVSDITAILTELETAIRGQLDDPYYQQSFLPGFAPAEQEQFERNVDALRRRLGEIPGEIEKETEAIRARFADPQPRMFPVAVTFLVPERMANEMILVNASTIERVILDDRLLASEDRRESLRQQLSLLRTRRGSLAATSAKNQIDATTSRALERSRRISICRTISARIAIGRSRHRASRADSSTLTIEDVAEYHSQARRSTKSNGITERETALHQGTNSVASMMLELSDSRSPADKCSLKMRSVNDELEIFGRFIRIRLSESSGRVSYVPTISQRIEPADRDDP